MGNTVPLNAASVFLKKLVSVLHNMIIFVYAYTKLGPQFQLEDMYLPLFRQTTVTNAAIEATGLHMYLPLFRQTTFTNAAFEATG
jgi:hypothetical protein